jgi:hypothetical protein
METVAVRPWMDNRTPTADRMTSSAARKVLRGGVVI